MIQNLPGQALLWIPYPLLRYLYHPLRWIRAKRTARIEQLCNRPNRGSEPNCGVVDYINGSYC